MTDFNINQTSFKSVQLGKSLDFKLDFGPPPWAKVNVVGFMGGMVGGTGQLLIHRNRTYQIQVTYYAWNWYRIFDGGSLRGYNVKGD